MSTTYVVPRTAPGPDWRAASRMFLGPTPIR
jgi:hypothetical protein